MSDGVLYKFNATTDSKSIAKKFNASVESDGVIKHANASTWFDNYPMEQYITAEFIATWSQGYRGDGVKLDDTTWAGNILTGSTTDYKGLYGFNQGAIASHIAGGVVTEAKLLINCYETTLNGAPDVVIGKHSFSSEPASWNGVTNADWGDYSTLHVNNNAIGGYWVTLKPTQVTLIDQVTAISGIALKGATALNEDRGNFNGVSSFNTKLQITVLK